MEKSPKELALDIAKALDDKKAIDIVALAVGHLTVVADYFVVASGNSAIQVRALANEVEENLSELGFEIRRREGVAEGRCVVLDYASVLVHIFHTEEREYYAIERLWDDGTNRLDLHLS